jgi:hypothetical protein
VAAGLEKVGVDGGGFMAAVLASGARALEPGASPA